MGGDALRVGGHHAHVGLGIGTLRAQRPDVQLDDVDVVAGLQEVIALPPKLGEVLRIEGVKA